MKIQVIIEVPDGTECTGCVHLYENVFSGYNCALFVGETGDSVFIEGFSKCPQCRAAEVKPSIITTVGVSSTGHNLLLLADGNGVDVMKKYKVTLEPFAEVKDDDAGMLEYDTDTGIYRVRGNGNSLDNLRVVRKEGE